jgi:hypothetical protein
MKSSSHAVQVIPPQLLCKMWSHAHRAKVVEHSKTALGAFLHIEVAFVNTSFDVVIKAAEQQRIGSTVCLWFSTMLGSRAIIATLAGESLEGYVANSCLHEVFCCLNCGALLWMKSYEDTVSMADIQWDTQMILPS